MAKREAFWHMDVKNAGLCKSVLPCFRPMFQGTSPYDMAKHMVLKYQPFWDPEDLPFFKTLNYQRLSLNGFSPLASYWVNWHDLIATST